jgi:hypothetical protein
MGERSTIVPEKPAQSYPRFHPARQMAGASTLHAAVTGRNFARMASCWFFLSCRTQAHELNQNELGLVDDQIRAPARRW